MWARTIQKSFFAALGVLVLCAISFILLQSVPGDPVLARLQQSGIKTTDASAIYLSTEYREMQRQMGYNLPPFYFSLQPLVVTDTIQNIPHPAHRKILTKWCIKYGNCNVIAQWYWLNNEIIATLITGNHADKALLLQSLLHEEDIAQQQNTYKWLINELAVSPINPMIIKSAAIHRQITSSTGSWLAYIPVLKWHGAQNQLHRWLFGESTTGGILNGNFGISVRDGQPVTSKLIPACGTTASLALIAIVLMYLVALPLGLRLSRIKNENTLILFTHAILGLYAMPAFWLGVLMLTFLCSPDFLSWFPVAYSMMNISAEARFAERLLTTIWHLALPVTCWSIGGAAFLTIQTFKQSKEIQHYLFVTTARAKGLPETAISRRHIFKNAIVPAVSMLGSIIPAALSGAIAIELIFSIPGMGKLIFTAFHTRDYPLVMGILILVGGAAISSTALADLLQYVFDPRLKKEQVK